MKYPETKILRPSVGKVLGVTLVCVVFTLVGWWMISKGEGHGWLVLITFGALSCLGLVKCLPGASGMVVMPDGFAVRVFFRLRFYPWREVVGFEIVEVKVHGISTKQVGFHALGNSKRWGATLSTTLVGYNDCLPETYGIEPEALAAAMNGYRRAALDDQAMRGDKGMSEQVRR